jgi:long-chain acyl-CoA synthetase
MSPDMPDSSLREYLANFERLGDECAYVHRRGYRTERWSYRQIAQTAFQFARELESRGVGKGDRVLIWGENCAEWVAAFFGCVAQGAVVVPMDHFATAEFAHRVCQQVGARLLVCSLQHASQEHKETTLILEDLAEVVGRHAGTPHSTVEVTAGDTLELIFTSGTTAEAKGVVITHSNVLANIAPLENEIKKYLKYERWVHPVRFLNLVPLSHVFGQFMGIFLPQLMGGTVFFQEALSPSEVIGTIRRERVSVLVAVPRMLQSLKEKIDRDVEDKGDGETFRREFREAEGKHFLRRWWIFRKVRHELGWKFWAFICGGATLDRDTEEFWGRLGYAVVQGYGLTETTSLISLNHPFRLGKGSIGKVLPGREVKLASDGEIMVRGGGVASA